MKHRYVKVLGEEIFGRIESPNERGRYLVIYTGTKISRWPSHERKGIFDNYQEIENHKQLKFISKEEYLISLVLES